MKTKIFTPILMVLLLVTFSVKAQQAPLPLQIMGETNSPMGHYQVKELPSETVEGKTFRTFEIQYENAKQPVKVYLDERKKCRDYIVRSSFNEVRYICKKSSFGAHLLNESQAKYDTNLNNFFTNTSELASQEKICNGNLPVKDALGLIACYYPELLKTPDHL